MSESAAVFNSEIDSEEQIPYSADATNATAEDTKGQQTSKPSDTNEKEAVSMFNEKLKPESGSDVQKKGMGWFVAALFIVAELVGGGVVAMPAAYVDTGIVLGTVFMLAICAIFTVTGYLLADTWEIMRERWPEYRSHCRKPFSEMGIRSMNRSTEIATKITVYLSLFGTTVVYILLSSKIFQNFLANFNVVINFCWLTLIVSGGILPITFLKSPADYWWAIVIAVLCTTVAIGMIFVGVSLDFKDCYYAAGYPRISVNAPLSLGIFLFAFNGHQVFPTVQNDMRRPPDFKKSVILGFFLVAILYMPLSVYSFLVYGGSMVDSVIDSVQTTWIRYVADLSIAVHCILAIIITINPVNLQLESTFNVPHKFCFKRVLVRGGLMAVALFVGLSLPDFGAVMNLFGSTTVPITCVILPSLFNVYIKAATYDEETDTWIKPTFMEALRNMPKPMLIILTVMNVITVICSVISTIVSIKAISTVRFTPPCYVLPFVKQKKKTRLQADALNCCGKFMNISRYNVKCNVHRMFFLVELSS